MSKKHVKALERVAKRIKNRKEDFICCALNNQESFAAQQVRDWIQNCIGSGMSVGHWLRECGYCIPYGQALFGVDNDHPDMIAYRLRWIDSMIAIVKDWP